MSILEVRLLGPPNVQWAGDFLTIPRRQVRALFYYLAAQSVPVPRARLCDLFWPYESENNSGRKLSHLLTHLRRALPPAGVIVKVNGQVGLNPISVWTDTTTFRTGQISWAQTGCAETLTKTVELYRGPFLDTFELPDNPEFECWLRQEQRSMECLYLNALLGLIQATVAAGNYPKAIHFTRRYLDVDDTVEEVHRCLIELYLVVGNRPAACR